MNTPKRRSLRFKLALFSSLLVVFVAVSFGFFLRHAQSRALREQMEVNRRDTLVALRAVAREAILVDDETDMVNYVNRLKLSYTIDYAMVLEPNGKVLVHTDSLLIGKTLDDAATKKAVADRGHNTIVTQDLLLDNKTGIIDVAIPIVVSSVQPDIRAFARIGYDKTAYDKLVSDALSQADNQIGAAFLIALILGLIGAITLASLITRPLIKLRAGAHQIGEGNLNHRIEVSTNDELSDLAGEFNLMATKLGELDQMKQDFVSNVTHELRSPLTSIRGYLDLLLTDAAGKVSEMQRDYLSVIKNSAVRLSRFIDNLLDVAKIEAHKLKLTPDEVDVRQMGHEMEVLFKPQLSEKNLAFSNNVLPSTPKVFVDKDKFAEILINLTSNAIKFTPENGQIELSTAEGPNYVEVRLQDSGQGIPPAMIGKLFNKFEQVKSNQGLARSQKGTGLGLAIVKGIIEAHGGKIWITSPAPTGRGSMFHFTLPKFTAELRDKFFSQTAS